MIIMWIEREQTCQTEYIIHCTAPSSIANRRYLLYIVNTANRWHLHTNLHFLLVQRALNYSIELNLKNTSSLTDCVHRGKYHVEPTKRCVCNTPLIIWRSTTSVPITAGFIGFGYFRHAACATVSHGWL